MHTIREITSLATMLAGLIAPQLRLGFVSASSHLRLTYASTTPWLRSPASIVARHAITQVRIAEGDNTAQYWPNIGSQESAIVIGPVPLFASVKCWADDGGLFRLFKFTDLQSKLGPVSALYQADCHFYYGIQF